MAAAETPKTKLEQHQVTRKLLTWNVTVYLFWSPSDDEDCLKIIEPETHAQVGRRALSR